MTTPTEEERKAAAEKVCIGGEQEGRAFFHRNPKIGYDVALQLQIQLTRTEKRLDEAEGLLRRVREFSLDDSLEFAIEDYFNPPADGE